METVLKIRRMHQVDGQSISAIAKVTGLSRNTVRKYLRQPPSEPPKYRRPQPARPKLGEFESTLTQWLDLDAKRPKRQRRCARQLFEDLQRLGYQGAYDSVQRFVRDYKQQSAKVAAFVPLTFAAGEAYQFDWSEEEVEIGGVVQRVKAAHFRLTHSRQPFVMVFPRETQEMVFAAHDAAFHYWGGVPRQGIYDNLKTCVDQVLEGKERRFNPRFLALMSHYVIEPVACTPASGWEKGQVEKQVQDVRRRCFTPRRKVDSLAELNRRLIQELEQAAQTRPHPDDPSQTVWQRFEQERTTLRPLAARFNGYVERELRVDSTCLIHFDRNTYSVDSRYAHRHVTARVFADRLQVYAQSELIAEHPRQFGRDKTQFAPWHYLDLLEHKPGALRHGAPFKEWVLPPALSRLQQQLLSRKGGDRDMVKLLLAARQDGLDLLEQACQQVLQLGGSSAELVLNHLQRLRRPLDVPQVHAQVVPLAQPPQANCQRYDSLLPGGQHVSR